jgi:hypothetical protein
MSIGDLHAPYLEVSLIYGIYSTTGVYHRTAVKLCTIARQETLGIEPGEKFCKRDLIHKPEHSGSDTGTLERNFCHGTDIYRIRIEVRQVDIVLRVGGDAFISYDRVFARVEMAEQQNRTYDVA